MIYYLARITDPLRIVLSSIELFRSRTLSLHYSNFAYLTDSSCLLKSNDSFLFWSILSALHLVSTILRNARFSSISSKLIRLWIYNTSFSILILECRTLEILYGGKAVTIGKSLLILSILPFLQLNKSFLSDFLVDYIVFKWIFLFYYYVLISSLLS